MKVEGRDFTVVTYSCRQLTASTAEFQRQGIRIGEAILSANGVWTTTVLLHESQRVTADQKLAVLTERIARYDFLLQAIKDLQEPLAGTPLGLSFDDGVLTFRYPTLTPEAARDTAKDRHMKMSALLNEQVRDVQALFSET